jgi:hypothetical protein
MAKTRFTSPVMRFVQGDLDTPQDKDAQGNPRLVKTGPNAGQPNPQFFMAGAIAKNDPAWPEFWALLCQQAAADFPNLFPGGPSAPCVHPQFAFKVIDGDGVDTSGKSNATKEGFAGHWVVRFASSYPPRLFYKDRYAPHEQIQEKGVIKRGYFVRVNGTVEGNANAQRPGLYVNLDMVELTAYGPEIVSGPDANEAFGGGAPVALPAGASAAPLTPPVPAAGAPTPGAPAPIAPPVPGVPAAGPTPAAPPVPGAGAPPLPAAGSPVPGSPAPAPYTGYMGAPAAGPTPTAGVAPVASPAAPVPTAPPSAPIASPTSGPVMLPAANGATYEQMIAAGWTDETLRAHGMMQ